MDWILSAVSLLMIWLMGRKSKWGPVVGLLGQVLWLWWAWRIGQPGLLVGVIAYTAIHGWNTLKWWGVVKGGEGE